MAKAKSLETAFEELDALIAKMEDICPLKKLLSCIRKGLSF